MQEKGRKEGKESMKLELISKSKDDMKRAFIVEGEPYWFVNTLRRMMATEVPVLAIEDVEFRKNDSAAYDEIVALRLGLLPIETDLQTMNMPNECTCKGAGCSLCQVKMKLKEKGPKTVYAKQIKFADPQLKVVYPDMPIVKLEKGQELEFEAIAILGQGIEHMKWSPGLVHFKYFPDIKIGKITEGCKAAVERCPLNILEEKAGKIVVNATKQLECHLCNACSDACPGITVENNENKHIVYIESWGQLKCKEMVGEATKRFENKLNELAQAINK